ncbi:MAG: CHASE2 domain-containing protein [Alphaproteobacteria bacterium]
MRLSPAPRFRKAEGSGRRGVAWRRGVREAGLSLFVALGVMLGLAYLAPGAFRDLETASLDLRFRLRGALAPGATTAVVLVDETSLARLGSWPLSRRLYADAVALLDRAGARIIAFDLLFAEKEEPVPPGLRQAVREAADRLRGPEDAALRSTLARIADDEPDANFAGALRASGKVLLPVAFPSFDSEAEGSPLLTEHVYHRLEPSANVPLFPLQPTRALLPIPILVGEAAGLGHVMVAFDRDGAPRYDYVAVPFDADFVPSLPVRAAAAYLGMTWSEVGLALGDGVRLGDRIVPTDPAMRLVVNYRGPARTIPTYSFAELIEGRLDPALFRDRIVLIGAMFTGIADAYPGPFDNTPIPGAERLATVIDMVLAGDFIRDYPPPWPWIVIVSVAVLAVATGIATALLPTRYAALAGALPPLGWAGFVQLAFVNGLWLPAVVPIAALAAAAGSVLLFRYGFVDRQRRLVQTAFRHYLAPALVEELAAHPERLRLGGEMRILTLMFADIRGFTAIAETYKSDPEGLGRLLNRGFLSPMTRRILARGGTIDKYIGDCIMAFWNAPLDDPDHADHACGSALAMLAELDRINRELAAEAEAEGRAFHPLEIGIGLNTGACVVGNMGSDERFSYTAIGDAVNLAARLEGQSKIYSVPIILGEATRKAAASWAALELDLVSVRGRAEPVRVYALLGNTDYARTPEFRDMEARHAAMLARYRAGDWAGARQALGDCRGRDPRLERLYDLYEERLGHPAANARHTIGTAFWSQ